MAYGQNGDLVDKAAAYYEAGQYRTALSFLRKIAPDSKTQATCSGLRLRAQANSKLRNFNQAVDDMTMVMNSCKTRGSDYELMGKAFLATDDHAMAREVLIEGRDNFGLKHLDLLIQGCDSAPVWTEKSSAYRIINQTIVNSPGNETSPQITTDGLVFSSTREGTVIQPKMPGNDLPSYDLFISKSKGEQWKKPEPFAVALNTSDHEVGISFSADGQEAFITRLNPKGQSTGPINQLYLCYAKVEGSIWPGTMYFAFLADSAAYGYATFSEDGNTLFFSSDRDGGFGGMDLYMCKKVGEGWSEPINLGPKVNTAGDELHPMISPDGQLYFSSDGHVGLGGFDLYRTLQVNDKWTAAANLGAPFNSGATDISLSWSEQHQAFFLASDRIGGEGGLDVYKVKSR